MKGKRFRSIHVSLFEGAWVFTYYLFKYFIKIGDAAKTSFIGSFVECPILEQVVFSLVDPVLVYEIREGHLCIFLKEPAKGGGSEVDFLCYHIYIGLALVILFDVLINMVHPLLIFFKGPVQGGPAIQLHHF